MMVNDDDQAGIEPVQYLNSGILAASVFGQTCALRVLSHVNQSVLLGLCGGGPS